ncbi:MAG: alkaline phosphatase family protein [Candidatus Heimdallarchaeota archaeon]
MIVGLDGLPWHILQFLIDRGIMPNLKKAVNLGTRATLRSTIPPYTSASWTSITTGVNPGKHGIFDFLRFQHRSYRSRLVNGLDIMYPRLHEMITSYGFRSVVINLPHSYPFLKSERNTIVTDWLTPKLIVYPDTIKNLVSSYNHSANWDLDREIRLSELDGRLRAVINLFTHTEWDLFFVVFSEPDWIMHIAYDAILSHRGDITARIYKAFKMLDKFIGQVISKLDTKDLLIVLSDHGFTAYDKIIHVNTILSHTALANYAKVKPKTDALGRLVLDRARRSADRKTSKKMPLPGWIFEIIADNIAVRKIASKISQRAFGYKVMPTLTYSINLYSSKAFTYSSPFGIYLNSKRMFNNGLLEQDIESDVIDEVIDELSKTRDPLTRCLIFSHIARREEIYWGPYIERAPHVIFIPNMKAGYTISRSQDPYPTVIQRKTHFGHTMYGLLVMYSNSLKSNVDLGVVNAYDIVPTVLHYLGLPVPHDTDGKILFDAFPTESDIRTKPTKLKNYKERWKVAQYVMKRSHKTKGQA